MRRRRSAQRPTRGLLSWTDSCRRSGSGWRACGCGSVAAGPAGWPRWLASCVHARLSCRGCAAQAAYWALRFLPACPQRPLPASLPLRSAPTATRCSRQRRRRGCGRRSGRWRRSAGGCRSCRCDAGRRRCAGCGGGSRAAAAAGRQGVQQHASVGGWWRPGRAHCTIWKQQCKPLKPQDRANQEAARRADTEARFQDAWRQLQAEREALAVAQVRLGGLGRLLAPCPVFSLPSGRRRRGGGGWAAGCLARPAVVHARHRPGRSAPPGSLLQHIKLMDHTVLPINPGLLRQQMKLKTHCAPAPCPWPHRRHGRGRRRRSGSGWRLATRTCSSCCRRVILMFVSMLESRCAGFAAAGPGAAGVWRRAVGALGAPPWTCQVLCLGGACAKSQHALTAAAFPMLRRRRAAASRACRCAARDKLRHAALCRAVPMPVLRWACHACAALDGGAWAHVCLQTAASSLLPTTPPCCRRRSARQPHKKTFSCSKPRTRWPSSWRCSCSCRRRRRSGRQGRCTGVWGVAPGRLVGEGRCGRAAGWPTWRSGGAGPSKFAPQL